MDVLTVRWRRYTVYCIVYTVYSVHCLVFTGCGEVGGNYRRRREKSFPLLVAEQIPIQASLLMINTTTNSQ